jgi:hypothetical protein
MHHGEYRGFRIRYRRADFWEADLYSPSGRVVGARVLASLAEGEAELLRRAAALIDAKLARTDKAPVAVLTIGASGPSLVAEERAGRHIGEIIRT